MRTPELHRNKPMATHRRPLLLSSAGTLLWLVLPRTAQAMALIVAITAVLTAAAARHSHNCKAAAQIAVQLLGLLFFCSAFIGLLLLMGNGLG